MALLRVSTRAGRFLVRRGKLVEPNLASGDVDLELLFRPRGLQVPNPALLRPLVPCLE